MEVIKILALAVVSILMLYLLILVISALLIPFSREYTKNSRFYRFLLYSFTAISLKVVRIRLHVTGIQKLPKDSRFLLVCNHRSKFDPIVTWQVFRKQDLAFISKPENFQIPVFGHLIHRCCFLPIDREQPKNAMKTILKAVKLIKDNQVSIAVYPEGTRSKDLTLLPFHNGVLKIAQKADVPIVVLSIYGTETIHRNYPLHHSDVYIDVLDVLSTEYVHEHTTAELGDYIRSEMETALQDYTVHEGGLNS